MKFQVDQIWQDFEKDKSANIRDKLMVKYLGLVHYVVNKLFKTMPMSVDREDLVNIGVIGLSEALDRYDPFFGIKWPIKPSVMSEKDKMQIDFIK